MLCKPRAQISRFMAGSITVMLFYVAQSKITTFHFTILNFSIPAQTFFFVSFHTPQGCLNFMLVYIGSMTWLLFTKKNRDVYTYNGLFIFAMVRYLNVVVLLGFA